jgi:hypothetical protein
MRFSIKTPVELRLSGSYRSETIFVALATSITGREKASRLRLLVSLYIKKASRARLAFAFSIKAFQLCCPSPEDCFAFDSVVIRAARLAIILL